MAQARRKKPAKKTSSGGGPSFQGLGMLVAGIVIGSLGTILWQGTRTADGGVGTGIRQMIETSRTQDQLQQEQLPPSDLDKPEKQSTNYDFFTVLPEIEVVVSDYEPEPPAPDPGQNPTDSAADNQPETESPSPISSESAYMLQAGSYRNSSDAERLKAELALKGMVSSIQKVSIQGRGDFYRVRLGPYLTHDEMVKADEILANAGIRSLRLKISKSG